MKRQLFGSPVTGALCSMLASVSFITVLQAQTNKTNHDTIRSVTVNEVVISATRDPRNVADIGKSITVIDMEKVDQTIYSNVGQLLAEKEGIYTIGTGQNPGNQQTIFLRGANSYHCIVMLDGVRISDPSSVDNGIDLSELSLANVERIEVVRGPLSTIYGSSAIGGVINIITKKNAKKPVTAGVEMTYGWFGNNTQDLSGNAYLNLAHKSGLYANLAADIRSVEGFNTVVDTVTNPKAYHHPDYDNFDKTDYAAKVGFRKKNADVFISYKRNDQSSDLDKGAYRDDDNRKINFYRNQINYGGSYKFNDKYKLSLSGGYSILQRTDVDDSSVVDNLGNYDHQYSKSIFDGSYFTNELVGNYNGKKITAVAGLTQSREAMNNYNYIYSNDPVWGLYKTETDLDSLNLNTNSYSAFLHTDLNGSLISDKYKAFSLALGARYTNHSKFGNNLTYEINPSYKFAKSLLFASWSTGFNAPSLYRLYTPDKVYGSFNTRGNPNLKPETSSAFEIGFKQYFDLNNYFTISYFNTKVKDVIEYVYLWDKNIGIDTLGNDWMRNDYKGDTYINLSEQNINGVEFELSTRLTEKLYASGNFSFVSGTTTYTAANIDTSWTGGNHVQLFENGLFLDSSKTKTIGLTRRPKVLFNISLIYKPIKTVSIGLDSRFVDSRNDVYFNPSIKPYGAMDKKLVNAYNVTNLSVAYEFSKNLHVTLKVENLLNTDYMEIYGFATRGRSFYVKLKYSF